MDALESAADDGSPAFVARGLSTQDILSLKPPLASRPALTSIDLCNNNIWDRGVQAVADAIRSCPSLSTVQLVNNSIGTTGAYARPVWARTHVCMV